MPSGNVSLTIGLLGSQKYWLIVQTV